MNFSVLAALFSSRSNYAIVDAVPRRESGYAEIGSAVAPMFAPEVH
jgi:UDP-3-O-[3-hydroxymyristoyl] N-acetylglucosamine deacetylase